MLKMDIEMFPKYSEIHINGDGFYLSTRRTNYILDHFIEIVIDKTSFYPIISHFSSSAPLNCCMYIYLMVLFKYAISLLRSLYRHFNIDCLVVL